MQAKQSEQARAAVFIAKQHQVFAEEPSFDRPVF